MQDIQEMQYSFDRESEKNTQKKIINLKDKQVIVYMPTWRGIMTARKHKDEQLREIIELMRYMEEHLT